MLQEVCLDTRSSHFLQKAKRKKKKKANAQQLDDNPLTGESGENEEEQETSVLLIAFRFSPCLYALSQKNKETQEGVFLSQI